MFGLACKLEKKSSSSYIVRESSTNNGNTSVSKFVCKNDSYVNADLNSNALSRSSSSPSIISLSGGFSGGLTVLGSSK